ncbi:hypothetical protein NKT34_00690 [Paenibacillus polysaccharolyticus]|uniref:hypothetical protein n=1 Tax=Paenibacillus polysaccharolyticus TaxID=582692 RepID=UPI00209DAA8C|nr:hypothetical protein [Paenibacillus polysaccharolyticus]MCP1131817.1 hypothetical protein [Paenibacillus polysaccharolyticus]
MMKLTEQGVLVLEEKDIDYMYCYRDRDGFRFDDSFFIELESQKITFSEGDVRTIHFQFDKEEYPLYEERERLVSEVQSAVRTLDPSYDGSFVK